MWVQKYMLVVLTHFKVKCRETVKMFQTYAVIGSGLFLFGIIYSYFFIRFLLIYKSENFSIISLSDSLVTVFIGVFYIYSAIVLSTNTNTSSVFNFTNNIDDIVTINTEGTFDGMFEQSITTISYQNEDMESDITESYLPELQTEETRNINEEHKEVGGSIDIEIGNSSYNVETTTLIETTINPTEKYDYQIYIKDLIKQKLLNSSYLNRKIFYNNREYKSPKSRTKRQIKSEKMDDNSCFNETFISNALFLYSFLHCSLTLVNQILLCKKDEGKVTEQKNEVPSVSNDSTNEKNENSTPIGPLFNDFNKSTETIKDLFKARSTNSIHDTTNVEESVNKVGKLNQKLKLTSYIVLMWLIPIIVILIFYSILKSQYVATKQTNYLTTLNLNSTQASPGLVNIIQNPTNIVPTQESVEVNNILKSVYNIVNEVQQQNTNKRKPHYSTSFMTDIVHFLNHKYRNSKDYEENCSIQEMPLKICFFIFIVLYVLVILYSTVNRRAVLLQNEKDHKFNMYILAFSILWLPSVFELFFRVFLTQTSPSILTDIFLTLGNTNRLFTMTSDYTKSKNLINNLIVVEPVV